MWLRDPKRPESRATLELGRSYTQHAPTTQHEVAAVSDTAVFRGRAEVPGREFPRVTLGTIFDLFRSSHTKGLKSSQTAVDLGDLTGGTMLMVELAATRTRRGVASQEQDRFLRCAKKEL